MSDMRGLLFAYSLLRDVQFSLRETLNHMAGIGTSGKYDHSTSDTDYVNARYKKFFRVDSNFADDDKPELRVIKPDLKVWKR